MKKKQHPNNNPLPEPDTANDKKYFKYLDEAYNGTLTDEQKREVVKFLKMLAHVSLETHLNEENLKADDKGAN